MWTGSLYGAGVTGHYWNSATLASKRYAYYFYFNDHNILLSHNDDRWVGFTVRAKTFVFPGKHAPA